MNESKLSVEELDKLKKQRCEEFNLAILEGIVTLDELIEYSKQNGVISSKWYFNKIEHGLAFPTRKVTDYIRQKRKEKEEPLKASIPPSPQVEQLQLPISDYDGEDIPF